VFLRQRSLARVHTCKLSKPWVNAVACVAITQAVQVFVHGSDPCSHKVANLHGWAMLTRLLVTALLAALRCRASESVFSVNDDVFAFPQVCHATGTCLAAANHFSMRFSFQNPTFHTTKPSRNFNQAPSDHKARMKCRGTMARPRASTTTSMMLR